MAAKLREAQPEELKDIIVDEELFKKIQDTTEPLLRVEGQEKISASDPLVELEVSIRQGVRLGTLK